MLTPTGMITTSATNPRDEIPIGPQVFPYGTPSVLESKVEPYQATNYQTGGLTTTQYSTAEAYPATSVQTSALATEAYPATTIQSTAVATEAYPTTTSTAIATEYPATSVAQTYETTTPVSYVGDYQATDYQVAAPNYQAISTPVPQVSYQPVTRYQNVVKYRPVTKTVYVPKLVTKYVPAPIETVTPLPGQTVPLPAPVEIPPIPATSRVFQPMATNAMVFNSPMPTPMGEQSHFVNNYPIYENDPRRVRVANPGVLPTASINPVGLPTINTSGLPLNPTLGVNPSLGGLTTPGLNPTYWIK